MHLYSFNLISNRGYLARHDSDLCVGFCEDKTRYSSSAKNITLCAGSVKSYGFNLRKQCFNNTIDSFCDSRLEKHKWYWIRYVVGFLVSPSRIKVELFVDGEKKGQTSIDSSSFPVSGELGVFSRNGAAKYSFFRFRQAKMIPPVKRREPENDSEAPYDPETSVFSFETDWTIPMPINIDAYLALALPVPRPRMVCFRDHELRRITTSEFGERMNSHSCDVCKKTIKGPDTTLWRCETCDFDVCLSCAQNFDFQ